MIPPGYRGHVEVETAMRTLRGAKVMEIGSSVERTPIMMAAYGPADSKLVSIVIAGIHAIEWIGVETALALAERFGADPPVDRRILLVSLLNPDGYRRIETDLWIGRTRFIRTNSNGVDLNRNWQTDFLPRRKWIARLQWPGPSPYSEPETKSIIELLDAEVARGARIDTALSLHSFGRKLLVPYGARWKRPARYRDLFERARRVQARLADRYTIDQVSHWVPGAMAYGMEIDDLHDRYGACALLVECAFGGQRLDEPSRWLSPFHWFNPRRPSIVATDIARAVEPFVRGA